MADIQIVMQVVGEKSIVNATKSTVNLENKVKSLSKSLEAGRISESQFSTGLKELRKTLDGNGKAWQSNKAQIDNYVKSLRSAEAAQKAATAAQEAAKKQAQSVREMNAALAAQRKAQDENTASLSRLRAGYDANYAAEQRRLELKRRLRQEVLNGNMTLREAGAELLKYRQYVQQFNTAQMAATKASNRFGVVTQQAGYQIGDFLVQVQSGTNYMVAFGQQATQLVGILPLLAPAGGTFMGLGAGALIGLSTGLGIVIPLLTAFGAYLIRSKKNTDETVDSTKKLNEELKSLDQTLDNWIKTKKAAQAGLTVEEYISGESIKEAEENLKAAKEALEALQTFQMQAAAGAVSSLPGGGLLLSLLGKDPESALEVIGAAEEEFVKAQKRLDTLRAKQDEERQKRYEDERFELEQQLAMQRAILNFGEGSRRVKDLALQQEIEKYDRIIDRQVDVKELTEEHAEELKRLNAEHLRNEAARKSAADSLRPLMGQIGADTTVVTEETIELTKKLGGSVEEAIKLQKALDEGKVSASQLRGIDLEKGITPAVKAAKELAEQLGISFRIAAALSGAIVRGDDAEALDPRSQRYDPAAARLARMKEIMGSDDLYKGLPKDKTTRGGGKTEAEELADRIAKLEEQIKLEQELSGKSEARKRVIQALGVEFTQQNEAATATYEAQIEAIMEATRLEQERQALMDSIQGTLESGFMSMVDGTKSVKDAFKDMARQIIAELYRVLVVQQMVGSFDMKSKTGSGIMGAIGNLLFNANGNAFSNGRVTPFANGGVVGSPTYFPMSGGQTGLMGEAGPEAIMPLKRDKNGRLGVSVEGGSGSVNVTNNINVTGGSDPAAIRMEVAKLMPQITNATKTAVIDARRRGGQMKAAFS